MNESYKTRQEIINNYRIICKAEPGNIENWLTLGRYLVEAELYEEAEQALTKIFEEGRFFSFKNGIPKLRFKTLLRFFKNRLHFARAYSDLAAVSLFHGNLAEAERQLSLAISEFQKANKEDEYARAANRLGMVYRLAGAYESAEELHYQAKTLAEKNHWPMVLAESLGNLGMVYEGKDMFSIALEKHHEALNLYLMDDKYFFEASCQQRQIGLCFLRSGNAEKAVEIFKEALTHMNSEEFPVFSSRLHNDLAQAYRKSNDLVQAIEMAKKAFSISQQSEIEEEAADNSVLLACLEMERDINAPSLESLLKEAIQYYLKTDKKAQLANAYATLGLVYLRRQEWNKAESSFKDSLHLEEVLQRCFGMASDYGNLGLIAQKKGNPDKASEYWRKASFFFEKGGEENLSAQFQKLREELTAGLPKAPLREE